MIKISLLIVGVLVFDFLVLRVIAPAMVSSTDTLYVGIGVALTLFLVWAHVIGALTLAKKYMENPDE